LDWLSIELLKGSWYRLDVLMGMVLEVRVFGEENLRMSFIILLSMIDPLLWAWPMLGLILMLVSSLLLLFLHPGWIISILSLEGFWRELRQFKILRILSVMIMINHWGKSGSWISLYSHHNDYYIYLLSKFLTYFTA